MSYEIHPIAVSLSQLELAIRAQSKPAGFISRLFGSSRSDLVAKVLHDQGPLDEDDGFDDDDGITVEQALRDLCSDAELNPHYGHAYAYALFALCNQFGEFLANSEWSWMRAEWGERVDEAMKEARIPVETLSVHSHLMYRGAPIDIPESFDFPFLGYLRNVEIAPAIRALEGKITTMPEEVRPAVTQVGSWLDRAQGLRSDLVFFYF